MATLNSIRLFAATFLLLSFAATGLHATTLLLKNGVELTGTIGKIPSLDSHVLAESIGSGNNEATRLIYVVDDGLRRVFVSTYQVHGPRDDVETVERIRLRQPIARHGKQIGRVGAIVKAGPFDDWGRRVITLQTDRGTLEAIQGITEVTPRFTRIRGLQGQKSYVWDMRIATSSIPRDTLSRVLKKHLDATDSEDRLSIVRLYLQSARYQDAEAELESAIEDLPELTDLSQQLREIRQLGARQRLDELKVRRKAGQHNLVNALIPKFPSSGVAGEILLELQDTQSEYGDLQNQIDELVTRLDNRIAQLDPARRAELVEFQKELTSELNFNNVTRLQDFWRLSTKEDVDFEQQLAIAMSGWLTDGQTRENLAIARSLWRSRSLVKEYLGSQDPQQRRQIISSLKSEEGGSVVYVAQLLAAMLPPRAPGRNDGPESRADNVRASEWVPGLFEIHIQGAVSNRTLVYWIQLPPEYDPYRHYPTILTLHGAGTTPRQQIDWWTGTFDRQVGMRTGPASRHGYIVIAPAWPRPQQTKYEFTANEHAAVLSSLRDAMNRFAIDTDRVFLSGHSIGGDAAWDIALAHPDLWAGVVPISATAAHNGKQDPKYVSRYWKNAAYVPQYFVGGSKDTERLNLNSRDFDRYLKKPGYDTLIVEYQGRGHEHFREEVHQIFDWFEVHARNFLPREFEAVTMRPWDSFFWWLEIEGLPARSTILPFEWPKRARPLTVKGRVTDQSNVRVAAGTERVTVLLAPPLVDFSKQVTVELGSRRVRGVQPNLETILEDARTRHDRRHPFWSKVQIVLGDKKQDDAQGRPSKRTTHRSQ